MKWLKELIEDNKYVLRKKGLLHLLKIWFILIFVKLPLMIIEYSAGVIVNSYKKVIGWFK